jgi:hypothetical protein
LVLAQCELASYPRQAKETVMPALIPTEFTATITWLVRMGERAATLR